MPYRKINLEYLTGKVKYLFEFIYNSNKVFVQPFTFYSKLVF